MRDLNTVKLLGSAASGALATVPMTMVMELCFRNLPQRQQHAIGPRQATNRMLEDFDLEHALPRDQIQHLSVAGHFAYGAACGAAYGAVIPDQEHSPLLKGVAFGMGVWAASYLGWLPAVGWHRSATREPWQRNLMMIAAHVTFGAALGILAARLASNGTVKNR